jgi:perosamine synthetase
MIPLCAPEIRGNEWRYVKDCLDTTWVSSVGAYVDRFEAAMADASGQKYAVATVNGTSALHVALKIAGIGPGDEVIVSTVTFIAPANAIRYTGATPVFIDAEPNYYQMDVGLVRKFLEEGCEYRNGDLRNLTSGNRVRAIVPVHILGHPVDMDPLLELARRYNLTVIEDATESLGAKYKGKPVGSFGDAACFSFNGNKLITTGGGGMFVTGREEWARKAKHLTTQAKDDAIEYVHSEIGYNYRLTNVLAAIGVAQLELLDEYVAAKRRIATRYNAALLDLPGVKGMAEAPWATSVFWMYTARIDEEVCGITARDLLKALAPQIQTRPLWQPMHQSPAHAGGQIIGGSVADDLYRRALSLPCSVGLTEPQQSSVLEQIALHARPTIAATA